MTKFPTEPFMATNKNISLEKILDIFPNQKYPIVSKKVGESPEQYPDFDDEEYFD
jgi:hypothetical protein